MDLSRQPATAHLFVAQMQAAVSCVSPAVVVRVNRPSDGLPMLTLPEQSPSLQGRHRLSISLLHAFALDSSNGRRRSPLVRSIGYSYQIRATDGPEVIAFHWHPGQPQSVAFPHLHVRGGESVPIARRYHVPTGRVSFEAVVRFAIEELGVRPLRDDWQQVLDAGIAAFDAGRSW